MARGDRVTEGFNKGRWRSAAWRAFVRSLDCGCHDPRCPNCNHLGPPDAVIAAHLRSQAGMGTKPDDFLCYPLSDTIHTTFHNVGHPDVAWQLERVTRTLRAGLRRGVIRIDTETETDIPW